MKRYKQDEINELAEILKRDEVISVPTDTIYGVCVRINSKPAYDRLVELKQRPASKSFPVMCLDAAQIKSIAVVEPEVERLIEALMPGPITLVLKKKPEAFDYINNAGERISDELAVRMAPAGVLAELLRQTGSPIFLTSANVSGGLVCETLDEIEQAFPELNGMLVGEAGGAVASTIVDLTGEEPKIQRPGPVTLEEIIEAMSGSEAPSTKLDEEGDS